MNLLCIVVISESVNCKEKMVDCADCRIGVSHVEKTLILNDLLQEMQMVRTDFDRKATGLA